MRMNRRRFMQHGALAIGGLPAVTVASTAARAQVPASDRITIGVIGCNGMGFADLESLLKLDEVACGALCDVDASVLERRAAEVEAMTSARPKTYRDYRELLDDPNIDAVVIGTPDHWHTLIMVDACAAGKDVYVEKPLANSIQECELMVRAAAHYDRVVQVGQWQRSGPHWTEAMDFVHSGKLGRIRTVRAWAYMNWLPEVPNVPDEPAPDGVDYDMWLGPAPARPFNRNRFHFNFRWYWDYAGGLMTDWGVHLIDVVLWGMQAEAPKSIAAIGGKFAYPDDAEETPDTLQALYEFDQFSMIWEHAVGIELGPFQRSHGIAFVGNDGTLVVDRDGWELHPEERLEDGRPEGYRMTARPRVEARPGESGLDLHTRNFIECMKSRAQPVCNPAVGSLAAVNAHLGNIAFRTGTKVHWDAAGQRFRDNQAANDRLDASYRTPWTVPTL